MAKTAIIRARVEPELKREVEAILAQLGFTASDAIQILLRQIQLRRGLPFDVRIPNGVTAQTLKDSKAGKGVKRFASKQALYADLGL